MIPRDHEEDRQPLTVEAQTLDAPAVHLLDLGPASLLEQGPQLLHHLERGLAVRRPHDQVTVHIGKAGPLHEQRALLHPGQDILVQVETGGTLDLVQKLRRVPAAKAADLAQPIDSLLPRNPEKPSDDDRYTLAEVDEALLTDWLERHVVIADWLWLPTFDAGGLTVADAERDAIAARQPPFNLTDCRPPWTDTIRVRRAATAAATRQ